MNGRLAGIPIAYWAIGIVAGVVGFVWMRQRTKQPSGQGATPVKPTFTQEQEVQDFQIFSALTGAQQASDLNFLGEVATLFAGGSSPTTNTPGSSPPSTGGVPPAVQNLYQAELAKNLPGGSLENFFLLNTANQQAGYDYYTSQGLQTTPLGVAPGE